ncbi:hypothetical protein [Paludisphaera mucosa]|uniref:Uncharacterized protein n=1 Tax=Paludisphaera mucosa TaxID=3030827 RepID=A0ABT6FEL9_9BACT|nr:hypothetical protein [Paludisphaera mucosa]MDG3005833.1 hypothetical protein [Paludisphaera mucosa]
MDPIGDDEGAKERRSLEGSVTVGIGDVGGRQVYTWTPFPPIQIQADPPQDFRIEIFCRTGGDGTRRFVPASGVEAFFVEASLGGLALLGRRRALQDLERFAYDFMRQMFQQAPSCSEHFDRRFRHGGDLRVAGSDVDVLPDRLGLDARGLGKHWSVKKLFRRGREQTSSNRGRPDTERLIAAGLLVAARRRPIDPASMSEADGRFRVRMALFDLGPGEAPVTPEVKAMVLQRLCRLVERHSGDVSAVFQRWFIADRSDLIRCIAVQRSEEGPIARKVVRAALLERFPVDCGG